MYLEKDIQTYIEHLSLALIMRTTVKKKEEEKLQYKYDISYFSRFQFVEMWPP